MNNPYPDAENTICLDFDGIIHDDDKGFHDGTIYGEPIKNTERGLFLLSKMAKYIVIYTCKARDDRPKVLGLTGKELIEEWLKDKGLSGYIDEITSIKPVAKYYIDDKVPGFEKDKDKRWKYILTEIIKEEF